MRAKILILGLILVMFSFIVFAGLNDSDCNNTIKINNTNISNVSISEETNISDTSTTKQSDVYASIKILKSIIRDSFKEECNQLKECDSYSIQTITSHDYEYSSETVESYEPYSKDVEAKKIWTCPFS